MRPSRIRFALILFLSLSLAGCTKQYQSERELYKATKLAKNIFINPDAIPPQEFNRAIDAYKLVFEKYPDTWSARRARLGLGTLYLSKKEFVKAHENFNKVLELYPDNKGLCLEARFAIAKTFEAEDAWDSAHSEYQKIMRDYPDSDMALGLPLYIAAKTKDYTAAVSRYTEIADKNPKTILGFKAENYIVNCYVQQQDWNNAVNSLGKMAMDYPMARTIAITLKTISDISVNRLNSPERAIGFFEKFLQAYPDHALKDALKKGIESLKNVTAGK